MEAHQHAYFDANILHCDISVGNILITKNDKGIGKGLLIDWDLCAKVDIDGDGSRTARRPDRTGTWQFMSAKLLRENGIPHKLEDDRESCRHVLTWMAFCYTKHTISGGSDSDLFLNSFDEAYTNEGRVKGGNLKKGFLLGRDISNDVKFDNRPGLDELIKDLSLTFTVRYEKWPSGEEIKDLQERRERGATDWDLRFNNALKYEKRMDQLKSRGWPVTTFRAFLDLKPWPEHNVPEKQKVDPGKRKNTEELPTTPKSLRLNNGSRRQSGLQGTE